MYSCIIITFKGTKVQYFERKWESHGRGWKETWEELVGEKKGGSDVIR